MDRNTLNKEKAVPSSKKTKIQPPLPPDPQEFQPLRGLKSQGPAAMKRSSEIHHAKKPGKPPALLPGQTPEGLPFMVSHV